MKYSFNNEKFEVPTEATPTEETNELVSGKVTSSDEAEDELSDLGFLGECSSPVVSEENSKNDTFPKRFAKSVMDREAPIHIEFRNHTKDNAPYIWVTTPGIEKGVLIDGTEQNASWLMNYLTKGEAAPIPGDEEQKILKSRENLSKVILVHYLKGEKTKRLRFYPLFDTAKYVKAVYHLPYGQINFNVPKEDDLVNLMKEMEYEF